MGCLLKTLRKGFVSLDKDTTHANENNTNNNKNNKTKEKEKETSEKEIDLNNNINDINDYNKYNSLIKNKDKYFKKEQIDYYINIYLKQHINDEPIEKLNFKKYLNILYI